MNYFSNHCYKDHLCNVYSQSSKVHLLHNDHFFYHIAAALVSAYFKPHLASLLYYYYLLNFTLVLYEREQKRTYILENIQIDSND